MDAGHVFLAFLLLLLAFVGFYSHIAHYMKKIFDAVVDTILMRNIPHGTPFTTEQLYRTEHEVLADRSKEQWNHTEARCLICNPVKQQQYDSYETVQMLDGSVFQVGIPTEAGDL